MSEDPTLLALRNLVDDWERVHGPMPEDHEAKAALAAAGSRGQAYKVPRGSHAPALPEGKQFRHFRMALTHDGVLTGPIPEEPVEVYLTDVIATDRQALKDLLCREVDILFDQAFYVTPPEHKEET